MTALRPVRGVAAAVTIARRAGGGELRTPRDRQRTDDRFGRGAGGGVGARGEGVVELFGGDPRLVERRPPAPVREHEGRDDAEVVDGCRRSTVQRRMRRGGPAHHQIGAQAFGADRECDLAGALDDVVGQRGALDCGHALLQFGVVLLVVGEHGCVALEGKLRAHRSHARLGIGGGCDVDRQSEAVQELRTQLAFLLVSGNETTRHLIGNMHRDIHAYGNEIVTLADDVLADRLTRARVQFEKARRPFHGRAPGEHSH